MTIDGTGVADVDVLMQCMEDGLDEVLGISAA